MFFKAVGYQVLIYLKGANAVGVMAHLFYFEKHGKAALGRYKIQFRLIFHPQGVGYVFWENENKAGAVGGGVERDFNASHAFSVVINEAVGPPYTINGKAVNSVCCWIAIGNDREIKTYAKGVGGSLLANFIVLT